MLFEIFIHPQLKDKEHIQNNLYSFFQFKNYLTKHRVVIYTMFDEDDFDMKKIKKKLQLEFVKITDGIDNIKSLWRKYYDIYKEEEWIIHYDIRDKIIEFDFVKMIYKKTKDTFVKKNHYEIYDNLFCINIDLMLKYIISNNTILNPEFIVINSKNYYFLKYMNIISKNDYGENIYI